MNKLSEMWKGLFEKWKGYSLRKKISFGLIFVVILSLLIYLIVSVSSTKYSVLFSNMETADAKAVLDQLAQKKISYKVEGNSILVPDSEVQQLRLEIASAVSFTNGSKGFELFDSTKFGATDQEMKITYQRALEGELERTIKGFSQIENARVHLVLPNDSVFVKDSTPAKASITLKIKDGNTLTKNQVKAIVALASGSVESLPKENVEILDDKMNLLTAGLDSNTPDAEVADSTEKQQQIKKNFEKTLENDLISMLEAVYGRGKVKVKVNADLEFDAVQQSTITYDPKNVIRSQHIIKDINGTTDSNTSNSPVDNNMTNTTPTSNSGSNSTNHDESTTNYEIGQTETKTVKAPGAVNRLTTSVVIDGTLNQAAQSAVKNLVVSAIGFDVNRGDNISVEGIPFDQTENNALKQQIADMNAQAQKDKQMALYRTIGIPAAAVLGMFILFLLFRRKKKKVELPHIDMVVDDTIQPKETVEYPPIDLEPANEKSHVENEIRKYAEQKPEQVADIIKSWLAEDER